jgi:general secretion pathway protein K
MPTSSRGSALLTVLWLTAALSAIGLAVANNVRGETERAATNLDDAKAYFLARGAIERALLRRQWGPDFYRAGDPVMDFTFPTGNVHLEMIPETSKLSLNLSPPEEIQRLLAALGVPEDRAVEITQAILDWRTPVAPNHVSPFDAFYLAQSPSFSPRHASFLENEELLLVKGMTSGIYYGTSIAGEHAGLRDCISAAGTAYALDINTARAETLQAVGIDAADAADIVRRRRERPFLTSEDVVSLQQSLGPAGGRLRIGGATLYTFRATARLRDASGKLSDMRRTVAALIKFYFAGNTRGRMPGSHEVIRWYDRG